MLAMYGTEVEDYNEEKKETASQGGFRNCPIFRQREIPIGKYRKFWFVPIAKPVLDKSGRPTGKYDWEHAVTPAWRVFRHYVPLPAGGEKKGFVTTCSGDHQKLRQGRGALDPDNCAVCSYIEAEGASSGRIDRMYVMLGFNYSVRKREIAEWIKQGRGEEDETEDRTVPKTALTGGLFLLFVVILDFCV